MKVCAHFFAQLRDLAGTETVAVDLRDGARVVDLLENLYQRFPPLCAHDKAILVGAGVEFVGRNYRLKPDEEIAIMPPVQGG